MEKSSAVSREKVVSDQSYAEASDFMDQFSVDLEASSSSFRQSAAPLALQDKNDGGFQDDPLATLQESISKLCVELNRSQKVAQRLYEMATYQQPASATRAVVCEELFKHMMTAEHMASELSFCVRFQRSQEGVCVCQHLGMHVRISGNICRPLPQL